MPTAHVIPVPDISMVVLVVLTVAIVAVNYFWPLGK